VLVSKAAAMSDRLDFSNGVYCDWNVKDELRLTCERETHVLVFNGLDTARLALFLADRAKARQPICPRCGTKVNCLKGHVGSARCRRLKFQRERDAIAKAAADQFLTIPAHHEPVINNTIPHPEGWYWRIWHDSHGYQARRYDNTRKLLRWDRDLGPSRATPAEAEVDGRTSGLPEWQNEKVVKP
jgi:hypothetical protein